MVCKLGLTGRGHDEEDAGGGVVRRKRGTFGVVVKGMSEGGSSGYVLVEVEDLFFLVTRIKKRENKRRENMETPWSISYYNLY